MSDELSCVTGKGNRSGDPGASRVGSLPPGASLSRRVYTQEFKNSAADLVLKEGYSAKQAARQLGISHKTLNNWIRPQRKLQRDQMITEGLEHDDPAALRAHIADLQRQLRKTEMERDILKKFSQYAATQMNP